jgi:hypothetical protein
VAVIHAALALSDGQVMIKKTGSITVFGSTMEI